LSSGTTLAKVEALIGQAEVQLAAHKLCLKREGRSPDPSDAFDQVGSLELWLAALREHRAGLLRVRQQQPHVQPGVL
jgi:hypothetical protein